MRLADNLITVTARAPELGESSVQVPIDYTGDELAVGLNPSFLIDALRAADSPLVTMGITDLSQLVVIEAGNYKCAIMPMNLG